MVKEYRNVTLKMSFFSFVNTLYPKQFSWLTCCTYYEFTPAEFFWAGFFLPSTHLTWVYLTCIWRRTLLLGLSRCGCFGEQPCWKMGTLTENQCWGAGDVKMFLLLKLLRALVLCCLMFSQFFHFLQVITMNAVFFQLSHTLLNMPASFNNLDNHSFFFMYPYIRQSVLHCLFNLTLVTMASFSSWCGQFVICL